MPSERLHLSAVTIGEIQAGIEITRATDADKARELETWLEQVVLAYPVLVLDSAAFREWGRLMHRQSGALVQDAMIAAVARAHGLTVVTRNVRDFEPFGVPVLDPFAPGGGR